MPFTGFQSSDFAAFVKKKQGSNVYTLERRAAKDKLLEVASYAAAQHPDAFGNQELLTTEDAPSVANGRRVKSLAAYFVRPAAARSGLKELIHTDLGAGAALFEIAVHQLHAHLQLRIQETGLTVGVRVPSQATVDRENVAEKLRLDWGRQEFLELVTDLPRPTQVGFEGELAECSAVDEPLVMQWATAIESSHDAFVIEHALEPSNEAIAAEGFKEEGSELVARFAPVFTFLAWSKANDHTRVQEAVDKRVAAEAEKQPAGLNPGDRVTILGGLFAGRAGYLAEVHKGKAKVTVGPVTVSVEVADLKPAG